MRRLCPKLPVSESGVHLSHFCCQGKRVTAPSLLIHWQENSQQGGEREVGDRQIRGEGRRGLAGLGWLGWLGSRGERHSRGNAVSGAVLALRGGGRELHGGEHHGR